MTLISSHKPSILLVDDTPTNLEILVQVFDKQGYEVFVATDGLSAIEQVFSTQPDLILLDVMMPGLDGFETCQRLKADPATNDIPVIFMTALAETLDKVKGFQVGAVDYVTKPIQHEEVLARVTTHLKLRSLQRHLEQRVAERTAELQTALSEVEQLKAQLQAENTYLREEIQLEHNFADIVSRGKTLKRVLAQIEQVAPTDASVLILGESGTGKELLARAVHNRSKRSDRPLVKVNCASLPSNLIESELFGHEKGAFTGALAKKIGRFELADKGTIFLDEIGELPLDLQAKLLRVLQEGEFERLGNPHTTKVNVRVIAATNRELANMVNTGNFREDLYYRLNVFPITSPPLRDRKEDIGVLVAHFLKKFSTKIGKHIDTVSQEAMNAFEAYHWPGNVRELENTIERAVILAQEEALTMNDLPELRNFASEKSRHRDGVSRRLATLEEIERDHILVVLKHTNWLIEGQRGAGSILGLNPSTLRSRMKKLNIKKPTLPL
ncbi:sigma-54 dependent transcriptional regulator [Candidatus Nitronereus thalassa]|uniref:Sigma-54 dependent transcriptional regulator n=1 Tax=Candidatus Nitronereus thalassa TaxID=3020898 RepID=A0ABU3K9Q6_9BACT|nr:sigma-54 dependent transcriptional regulator [Candidatus Nitronereus thalassa]MDT7043128.1 sigma-54 dependent transcriptional regulator [Candidatus Nitronereus thalassa]